MTKKLTIIAITLAMISGLITGCSVAPEKPAVNAPQENVSPANPASVHCQAQDGRIEIHQNEQGEYGVCVFADGSECEEWAYYRGDCLPGGTVEPGSTEVARKFINDKVETYRFDGSGLIYERTEEGGCDECSEYIFSFTSSHTGYGDREGQVSAQVITPHTVVITMQANAVIGAVIDGRYDEIRGKFTEGWE